MPKAAYSFALMTSGASVKCPARWGSSSSRLMSWAGDWAAAMAARPAWSSLAWLQRSVNWSVIRWRMASAAGAVSLNVSVSHSICRRLCPACSVRRDGAPWENRADGAGPASGTGAAVRIEAADEAMFRERDAWRYDPPYDFYDGDGRPVKNPELFYAVRDDEGALTGFYFFQPCDDDALFYGLGLRPDLTGRGLGEQFMLAGLEFARTL